MNSGFRQLSNLKMLEFVASRLGQLKNEVVFLGGCTTSLFITDQASPDVRYTLDVDCIVDIISLSDYHKFERKLSAKGFKRSMDEEVICRWHFDDIILDVMPTEEKVLGFSNRWYKSAVKMPIEYRLPDGQLIKLVTAPHFIATKFEAFKTRGHNDFMVSHDFEDIVTIMDGRFEIVDEINNLEDKVLKHYLSNEFNAIKSERKFLDALPGHFSPYGMLAIDRINILMEKIEAICCNEDEM